MLLCTCRHSSNELTGYCYDFVRPSICDHCCDSVKNSLWPLRSTDTAIPSAAYDYQKRQLAEYLKKQQDREPYYEDQV